MGRSVTLLVPAYVTYHEGDGFDVFFDNGTGTVDYTDRMNGHREPLWPGAEPHAGYGLDGHGLLRYGDSVSPAGWGGQAWGFELYGYPAILRIFETWPLEAGDYRFAVGIFDAAGNRRPDPPAEQAVSVEDLPRPASNFHKVGYDPQTGQLTLGWDPSPSFA